MQVSFIGIWILEFIWDLGFGNWDFEGYVLQANSSGQIYKGAAREVNHESRRDCDSLFYAGGDARHG